MEIVHSGAIKSQTTKDVMHGNKLLKWFVRLDLMTQEKFCGYHYLHQADLIAYTEIAEFVCQIRAPGHL